MFVALSDIYRDGVGIETENNSYIIRNPIAFCTHTERRVAVVSKLTLTFDAKINPNIFYELSFEIESKSADDSFPPFATQDREIAANYIPSDIRKRVLDFVRSLYRRLVRQFRPGIIYRVTKSSDTRHKVLRKHDILTSDIENEGYRVIGSGADPFGRTFWIMESVRD